MLDLRLANKRVFEALVKSGACDSLVGRRHDRASARREADRRAAGSRGRGCSPRSTAPASTAAARSATRTWARSICSAAASDGAPGRRRCRCPTSPPWTEIEQLNYEKDALGLFWTGHPIDRYADDLREYGAKTTADLNRQEGAVDGEPTRRGDAEVAGSRTAGPRRRPHASGEPCAEEISIGGIVSGLRPLKTRKGDRMCVFMLDDADGSIEVVVFPEAFKQYGHLAGERPDGAGQREVRAGRRVGADAGVGDRADRDRARAAGHVGGDPAVDAAARPRDVRAAVGRVRAAQGRPARGVRHRAAATPIATCA